MPEDILVSYLSGDPIVAYMAIQFSGISENNGWLPTSWGEEVGESVQSRGPQKIIDALPVDTSGNTPAKGPGNFKAYGPVMAIEWSIGREYVNGSYGGARSAFKPDYSNVEIEREVDQISPYLMQYAATGTQIANVHIVHQVKKEAKKTGGEGEDTSSSEFETVSWIRLEGCLVGKYGYGTKSEQGEKGKPASITHYERIEFNYSTITLQSNKTSQSWNENQ